MNKSKLISLVLGIALIISMTSTLASCDNTSDDNTDTTSTTQTETTTEASESTTEETTNAVATQKSAHNITVKSEGQLMLGGVEFEIYGNSDFTALKAHGETNVGGKDTVNLVEGQTHYLKILSAPDGYEFEEVYEINSTSTEIILKSYLRDEAPAANFTYQLGDVVHNFTLAGEGDNAVTLKDALDTYGCVVLNFWYIGCGPCKAEFPYIQSAYEKYADKVGFYALNGVAAETQSMIDEFKAQNGYTFNMSRTDSSIVNAFGVSAFPTTVVIDKYGVVCFMETGSLPEEAPFINLFELFSSPEYSSTILLSSLEEIPEKE